MSRLLLLLVLLLLPTSVVLASEPASGELSKASPKTMWTGATTNSYFNYTTMNADNTADCQPTMCDTFALKVVDGGIDLVIKVRMDKTAADGSDGQGGVRLTKPDGSIVWATGPSGPETDLKVTVKKAPAGDYVVDFVNTFVGGTQTFQASAELAVPAASTAPTAPAPPVTEQPAPPQTQLTVKPVKARSAKKLKATVSTSAPLTNVSAVLARGGKRVATAKLSSLSGTRKIALKARKKLKPGKYLLTVDGTDANGRAVSGQAAVTIRR